MRPVHYISVSGGKDSTAMALLALERAEIYKYDLRFVFADTGNEHPETLKYLDYLEQKLGIQILRLKADFSARFKRKRHIIGTKWRREGVPEWKINQAMGEMYPTHIPFLDLALIKGRFPSRRAQFCTEELKAMIINDVFLKELGAGRPRIYSWQGIRAEESRKRAADPIIAEYDTKIITYRPIKNWSVADGFNMHRKHDVKPNPLYTQGMRRVGCMPCVNCSKKELRAIGVRFPDVIARIADWEKMVARASKYGAASFFHNPKNGNKNTPDIHAAVAWAKTDYGGQQYDLLRESETPTSACSSAYGLCDGG